MSVSPIAIASEPSNVYRALLRPADLAAWWGCTVVTDACAGGTWTAGWGEGGDGLGQATVLTASLNKLEPDRLVVMGIGETEIAFHIDEASGGSSVRLDQPGADPATQEANLKSWFDAIASLKIWVEREHPYTQPAQTTPAAPAPPIAAPTTAEPPGAVEGEHGSDPYAVAGAAGVTVVDEGGFGVTDPNAVVTSFSKEQGFGHVTHAQLGDLVFDHDGCDFNPEPGDEVLLLVIGKRYDGKPKIKRIACPAKGSNIQ